MRAADQRSAARGTAPASRHPSPRSTADRPRSTAQLLNSKLAPFPKHCTAAHINAQSLRGHVDEVRAIFQQQNVDIIAITESWLKPTIPSAVVDIVGYSLYRNDRLNKNCGGVAVYIKNNLRVKILYSTPQEYAARPEFMFLEVGLSGADALLFGVCYRPPRVGHMADFEDALLALLPRYTSVLVMGDMNTDLLKTNNYESVQLTNMFQACNLTILPLNATHHTAETNTLIDLMAVSDPDISVCHGQISVPAISHHDLIFCVLSLKTPRPKPKFITYRNFRVFNEAKFLADVYSTPWHSIENLQTVDTMIDSLNSMILGLYNKHAPIVTRRINKKKPTPWITEEILSLMAKRDSTYRRAKRYNDDNLLNMYRHLRNQVKQKLRNARLRYINLLFSDRNQSSALLWRNVKKLGLGKQLSPVPLDMPLNELNKYFSSFSQSPSDIHIQHRLSLLQNAAPADRPLFQFKPILPSEVLRAVQRIRSNAAGIDNISISLIKRILFIIIPALTAIFNTSIRTGIFPEKWKSALIRPLNKIPSPTSPQDYRPISILPVLSKALERIVHSQVSEYLNLHNILHICQSGFRKKHSSETALLKVTDDIRLAMDRGQCTILTLFDFSKAFDTVNHSILLAKLKTVGFSENVLSWMGSYLGGRRQCVSHDNVTSDWMTITGGVPQGSILGPLLFTIYVNDIHSVLLNTKFHSYADDLQIYAHFKVSDLNGAVTRINDDIVRLSQWAREHGLKLNPEKTQPILIAHPRVLSSIDMRTAPKVTVNNTSLTYQNKVKSLGLIINSTLGWTETVVNTCNRVFAAMHTLKRLKSFLPFHIKLLLVKTLVFPHFSYCSTVINDMTANLSARLQRTQNYCIRYLYQLQRDEHITPYYIRLAILKQKELRMYRTIMLLHSIIKTGAPPYLYKVFEFVSERSARENRSSNSTLRIPHHRTTKFSKSFTVTACRTWNALPGYVKSIESRALFAAALKKFFLNQMSAGGGA